MKVIDLMRWIAEHQVPADAELVFVEHHASSPDEDGYDDYGGTTTGRLIPLDAFDLRKVGNRVEVTPPPER